MTRKPPVRSFYAEVLAQKEAAALERAHLLDGVDDIISVTHLALRQSLTTIPRNLPLVFRETPRLAFSPPANGSPAAIRPTTSSAPSNAPAAPSTTPIKIHLLDSFSRFCETKWH